MNSPDQVYVWIDQISTIASVPLALLGFGVTIWQLVKTRNAATAAKHAANSTLEQVQRLNLTGLILQLIRIDNEIDRAVQVKSVELLRVWIAQWMWHAGETRGHLNPAVKEEKAVMTLIQSSITAASNTKDQLHTVPSQQLVTTTAELRKKVGKVTSELGALSARQINFIEGVQ